MVGRMQSKPPPRSTVSESTTTTDQDAIGGRSCLAFRFLKNRSDASRGSSQSGRRRNNTSARSSVSSGDLSDDTQGLLSDQAPLLDWNHSTIRHNPKYLSNQSPTSTMDLPTVQSNSPQQHTQQQTQNNVKSLLVPPVPTNRSPQIRQRRQHTGLYDGEVEPQGVRGEEAVVSKNNARPPRTPGAPLVRTSFEPSSRSAHMYGYPSAVRQINDSLAESPTPSRSSIDRPNSVREVAPLQLSSETGQAVRWTGSRVPGNQRLRFADAESTASDDDIHRMMHDLMPSPAQNRAPSRQSEAPTSTPAQPSQPAVISPESPGLSRAAQQAAAAAAAVSHARSSVQSNASTESSVEKDLQHDLDRINALAMEQVHLGDYERALAAFTQVLEMQRRTHGDVHPAVASAHHNLGTVYAKRAALIKEDSRSQMHCRSQALECFQVAARVARDSLGKNHPNVAVSLVRIGFLLLQSRQYGNAAVTFQEALRIRLVYYGPRHGLVANLYNNLGVCHMHLQEFEKGKQQLEHALSIQRQIIQKPAEDSWVQQLELAETLFNIGGLCLEWIRRQGPHVGRAKHAEVVFQEALNIRTTILGPNNASVVQVQSLIDMAQSMSSPSPSNAKEQFLVQENKKNGDDYGRAPLGTHAINGRSADSAVRRSYNPAPKVYEDAIYSENQRNHEPDGYRSKVNHDSSSQYNRNSEISAMESEADDDYSRQRRIRIEPFCVPETSPIKGRRHNDSNDAIGGPFSEGEHFSTDKSFETPEKKRFGFDDEESFMLRDTGVDSFHGRIHYPRSWQQAGMARENSESKGQGPDIIVTKPYQYEAQQYAPSVSFQTKEIKGSKSHDSLDQNTSFDRIGTISTGNSDRDDVMRRAAAILSAHRFRDSPQSDRKHKLDRNSPLRRESPKCSENNLKLRESSRQGTIDHDLVEDGLAPLGGYWPSRINERGESAMKQLLVDPTSNLPAIHAEAIRLLKNNYAMDAWNLFEIVLQCQRDRHGPLHPDVASALHNVGISQLRADSQADALKSFEEAARIRKGSLGSEHPLVAVSMVKIGICLLLLHRFDQALWTFREALSIRKKALGPLHPSTARIYNNIGCVHVEFNEYQEARRAFEAALDVQRNALCHEPDSGSLMFACLVLKEAVDLQERVLGRSNATVLPTLDNLADSYANSGDATEALRTYNMIFERFRSGGPSDSKKVGASEAVLLYKMSRVHSQQKDRESQLNCLKMARQALLSVDGVGTSDSLERQIEHDIRTCKHSREKSGMKWL